MRAQFAFCTAVMTTALFSSTVLAEGDVRSNYSEPTRGFYIEHGTVAKNRDASIELHSGSDSVQAGGGVRLGLPSAELIINSGLDEYDENQLLIKYGLSDLQLGGEGGSKVHWAFTGAYSRTELEDDNGNDIIDQINLKLGAAFTVNADAATFTLAPRFVYADGSAPRNTSRDDTFVELDLGAYVGIIDTQAGLFSAGVEALFTTADNTDDTYAAGVRWAYDNKLNIDFVPLVFSNRDLVGVPGLVRVNYNF